MFGTLFKVLGSSLLPAAGKVVVKALGDKGIIGAAKNLVTNLTGSEAIGEIAGNVATTLGSVLGKTMGIDEEVPIVPKRRSESTRELMYEEESQPQPQPVRRRRPDPQTDRRPRKRRKIESEEEGEELNESNFSGKPRYEYEKS